MTWGKITLVLLRLLLVGACLYAVQQMAAEAHWHRMIYHIFDVQPVLLVAALLCVGVSYLALVGYDYIACRYLRQPLPLKDVAIAASLTNAISNMLGFALLSGSAVRLRSYGALGVAPMTVGKISLFCTATFLLGLTLAAACGLLIDPILFSRLTGLPVPLLQGLAGLVLLCCLALPFWAGRRKQLTWRAQTIALPAPGLLWAQYVIGFIDILATGSVLFLLLDAHHDIGFLAFITLFTAALWLGLISHVPGGLGVFEAVMLGGLSHSLHSGTVLAALFLYRVLYYVLPFIIAALVLVVAEGRSLLPGILRPVRRPTRAMLRLAHHFLPTLLAGLIALAGCVLLVSGATPAASGRLDFLHDYLALGWIEGSHLLGSIIGLGLLVVARGVYLRYDSAYVATMTLLGCGMLFSLAKGLDYEEAAVLAVLMPVVYLARRMFYRRSKISMLDIGWSWWVFIILTLLAVTWLLFFAYRHVEYENVLWWQFALDATGDASRSLRSMLIISVLVFGIGLHQLFRGAEAPLTPPSPDDIAQAARIIATAPNTTANLALTGDKYLLFNHERDAFIMYGRIGNSLIALGDPVGRRQAYANLIWLFRELADQYRCQLAFYQASTECLPLYIDAGFQFVRLGEEAFVPLADFTLEGGRYRTLRQTMARGTRDGLAFAIEPVQAIPALEPALRAISDDWLQQKQAREKGFSLGFYRKDYIEHFPAALVRQGDMIVAFANLWASADKAELSVDLMRHNRQAPASTMDYLFGNLLQWGKEQGYRYFNLGMAPLAGFQTHRLAPLWNKVGAYIYTRGERLYNFQGVHAFKEKYHPEWRPRYLAYNGQSSLLVLLQIALLIAGGWKGLIRK